MLQINKNYVLDQNQKPIAVQIPITEFEQIEEILENYGLAKLMEEVETDEILSKQEALKYLELLKNNNVESWIYKVEFSKPNFFRQDSEYSTILSK